MAKQDFAQVKASTQSESGSGSSSLLRVISIVVIAGLSFSSGYWLGAGDVQHTGNKTDTDAVEAKLAAQVARNRVLQAKNETLQHMVLQWKTKSEQGAHTKVGELTFYKELPKQSVTPAPVPDPSAATVKPKQAHKPMAAQQAPAVQALDMPEPEPVAVAAPSQASDHNSFRIQLASFRTESGAMAMQRKLARSGFSSQVKVADLGEKGQWFRLYAGPYGSRSAAEKAQQQIDTQMKLKGFIIRDR